MRGNMHVSEATMTLVHSIVAACMFGACARGSMGFGEYSIGAAWLSLAHVPGVASSFGAAWEFGSFFHNIWKYCARV